MAQGSLLTVDSSSLQVDGEFDVGAQLPPRFTANFPATFSVNSGFAQIGSLVLGSGSNLVGTLTLSGGTLVAGNLGIGNNGTVDLGSGTGIATVNRGTLSVSSLTLGSLVGGSGSLQISNATVNVLSNITLVSSSPGTTSSLNISGGSFSATNGVILVGPNGSGLFTISGGKHFIRQLKLGGSSANSSGHFVISGGRLQILGIGSGPGDGLDVNSAVLDGDVDGTGTSVTIGDNGHSASATLIGSSGWFNSMYVGYESGYTGTYNQYAGTMTILSNLIVGADCANGSAGAVGTATVSGGWLFVTNSDHTAVLDVRNGSFTLESGAVLVVDNLVVTNDCGYFTNNGGIIIPGNSFYTGNLLLNPGGEDTLDPMDSTSHLYPWTTNSAWITNSSPGVTNFFSRTDDWAFYGGTGAGLYGSLNQTVYLVDNQGITAAAIDSGRLLANVIFWEQTGPDESNLGPNYDYARVSLSFLDSDSNTISTLLTSTLDAHIEYWSNYTGQYVIPATTRSLQYAIDFHSYHSSGAGDQIYEDDNLLFVSGVQSPRLNWEKAGDNIVLSWPAWAANFDLQSSTTLAKPIPWKTVTNVPVAASGRFFVTNSMPGAKYYRLRGKY
jgi:hypothetical protein